MPFGISDIESSFIYSSIICLVHELLILGGEELACLHVYVCVSGHRKADGKMERTCGPPDGGLNAVPLR